MIVGLIIAALVVGAVAFVWLTYNRMVARRNAVDNSWSQIDVELKRRHDLIPALVEAVSGYAGHERTTFERVAEARGEAIAAEGPPDRAAAEGTLSAILGRVLIIAEAYPELEASDNFAEPSVGPRRDRGPDRDRAARLQRHGRDLQHADPGLPAGAHRARLRLHAARVLRRPGRGRGRARGPLLGGRAGRGRRSPRRRRNDPAPRRPDRRRDRRRRARRGPRRAGGQLRRHDADVQLSSPTTRACSSPRPDVRLRGLLRGLVPRHRAAARTRRSPTSS